MHSRKDTDLGQLIQEVSSKGFSARKSEKAVKAVFAVMKRALYRGENVEIPGGEITAVTNYKLFRMDQKVRNAQGETVYRRLTINKGSRRIRFVPDKNLRLDCDETRDNR